MQHSPSTISANRNTALVSWVIFAAIPLVYLLFPTRNYYWDGIFFARVIENSSQFNSALFHPSHLLYNVVGYGLYKATRAVGLQLRALEVLQFANSVFSVLTSYLLYQILKRTVRSDYLVWALTLLFAFSSTWWAFSTDANAYIFSVFWLLVTFYFTLQEFEPRPILVALIFSVAVLFHQLAVIAYPVIALALFWQATGTTRRRIFKAAQFCILSFVTVVTTYYLCFSVATGSFSITRFASWVTYYSPDASFSFDLLSNLGYTLRGSVRLFFQGRFSLLKGLINPIVIVGIVVLGFLVLAWIISIVKGRNKRDLFSLFSAHALFEPRARIYLLWLCVYLVFLFFWLPHNTFYRLFYVPALVLLVGQLINRKYGDRKPTYRLALFVAVMALSNFIFFIYPNSHVEKNPPLSLALEMNRVWQPGAVVYFHSENSDNNLMAYFNPAIEWRQLRDLDQTQVELKQIYDQGKTAWLEASAIDQIMARSEGAEWLARHGRIETWHERKARGYNVKFIQVGP